MFRSAANEFVHVMQRDSEELRDGVCMEQTTLAFLQGDLVLIQ